MNMKNVKFNKITFFLPTIMIVFLVYVKIQYFPSIDSIQFVDYHIFYSSFDYFPDNIYGNNWFIYMPSFFIQFFWIPLFSFNAGLIIWFILYDIQLTYFLIKISNDPRYSTPILLQLYFFVLIYGLWNEVFVANSDIFLLSAGYGSFLLLQYSDTLDNESRKFKTIQILAGIIFALGCFKPLVLVFFPLLLYKSKSRSLFLIGIFLYLIQSNYLFITHLEYIKDFWLKIRSGQTVVGSQTYYKNPFFNTIWRNGFTPPRCQIFLFPTVCLYVFEIFEEKKTQVRLISLYSIFYLVFIIVGYYLFKTGY